MKLRYVIVGALMMMGCEFHSHSGPVVYKPKQHSHQPTVYVEDPGPTVIYTEPETVVYVEEVYMCEPPFDPVGIDPSYCTDYGVGTGYCCTYEYGDWDFYCAEEWCWWEDMCYWDHIVTTCSELY